ncbi:UNVERIFIED_CONTAM: Gag polyprotein [Sesamum latifolium]|uniref:Gag polyprotein n=1 Tax=Sesamum latifolium TaxID=2727402 RepID=A0AAW2XWW4_9LAMI
MMLSLVEKLNDLQANFEKEETYVNVIPQSLPPSFDQFIINYNMNGLEKSLNELINTLVHYEATIEKSAPSVLMGEASTSKVKGKVTGREKRKKDETSSTIASTSSAPVTPLDGGEEKRKRVCQSKISNDVCIYCKEKGHWKKECPKLLFDEGKIFELSISIIITLLLVLDTNEFINLRMVCK